MRDRLARIPSPSPRQEEASIRQGAALYQRTSEAGISPVETECAAFTMIIRDLGTCTTGPSRVTALGRNHMLWSLLIKDLARSDNSMPDGIKAALIKLGLWAMQYSTLATLKDVPLQPLIDVNRNVVEGLRAQGSGATPPVATATRASFAI